MTNIINELPALLIIDMVNDNFDEKRNLSITPLGRQIIDPINRLSGAFRKEGWPVVFATDAFHNQDFIFSGPMKPHSLEGTRGAQVIDELVLKGDDLWLPKPRFSAFFRTGLDQWLAEREITLCAVAGIATNVCVLSTALDAICCDFKAVILKDCAAATTKEVHEKTLDIYHRTALYPLLRTVTSTDLLAELREI
jgi:nicotinamidase-related amidase